MNNFLKPKYLWISLLLHLLTFMLIDLSYQDSRIQKLFVAYGRHSKRITHAYFRRMRSPRSGNYQRYLQARRKREQANIKKRKAKKKRISKKRISKKQTPKKRISKKQTSKKKVAPKKPKVVAKKDVPKKQPQKRQLQKEIKKVAKSEENDKIKVEQKKEELSEEEFLHFNLMGETDPKVLIYQQHIQYEVDRLWRPPLGVPKGTECIVTFVVDRDGTIKNFTIDQKSKVLIYDLSIVRVGKEFKFHKCLWGKSFTINFRQ